MCNGMVPLVVVTWPNCDTTVVYNTKTFALIAANILSVVEHLTLLLWPTLTKSYSMQSLIPHLSPQPWLCLHFYPFLCGVLQVYTYMYTEYQVGCWCIVSWIIGHYSKYWSTSVAWVAMSAILWSDNIHFMIWVEFLLISCHLCGKKADNIL